jgi:peptidylprolyl isomerase
MARFNRYATCQSKMQRIIVMSVKALGLTVALLVATSVALPQAARAQAPADPQNTIVLTTKDGPVTIRLRPDLAPKHVERIKALTKRGFYDGIVFHRVIDGFMAQTGDPTGTGTGRSDLPNLPAEFTREPYKVGSLGMARAQDPNSANSQFFICFEGCGPLTGQYTLFGEVVSGMDNVRKIKKGDSAANGAVRGPDKIISMKLMADAR